MSRSNSSATPASPATTSASNSRRTGPRARTHHKDTKAQSIRIHYNRQARQDRQGISFRSFLRCVAHPKRSGVQESHDNSARSGPAADRTAGQATERATDRATRRATPEAIHQAIGRAKDRATGTATQTAMVGAVSRATDGATGTATLRAAGTAIVKVTRAATV